MNNPTGTKSKPGSDPVPAKARYSTLIEKLVKEEIEQRERSPLADWRIELGALRAGRS